jgi:hypothetical protein
LLNINDGQLALVTKAANDLVNFLHDVWLDACQFVQRDQPGSPTASYCCWSPLIEPADC